MHLPSASAASYSCANRMSPSMMARRGGVGMLIPDVPWYESQQAGWAGSLPNEEEGMGHGVLEQVRIATQIAWLRRFAPRHSRGGAKRWNRRGLSSSGSQGRNKLSFSTRAARAFGTLGPDPDSPVINSIVPWPTTCLSGSRSREVSARLTRTTSCCEHRNEAHAGASNPG